VEGDAVTAWDRNLSSLLARRSPSSSGGHRNLELPELSTRSSPSRFWSTTAVALPPHQWAADVPKLRPLRLTSSLRRGRQRGEAVATPS
jgi:hypothetical protein